MVLVPVSACSSSTTTSPSEVETADAASGSDAGTTDAASKIDANNKDASAAANPGGACNALVNTAPEAMTSTIKGNAPTATGGTIADGTYFLTDLNLYEPAGTAQPSSPSGFKTTMSIKGNKMDSVQVLPDDSTDTFAETFVVSGTALNRTLSCPKVGADLAAVYSVSGSTLTIYETDPNSKLVAGSVYAKQ